MSKHGEHGAPLTETQLRVRALESLLVDKGLVDPAALDALIDTYENKVGPRVHALLVLPLAGAWVTAGLVQGGTLPLARGDRSARLAEGARNASGGECRSAGMGFDGRGTLPRTSRAAGRDRGVERGKACRDRHARCDDRCCESGAARGG